MEFKLLGTLQLTHAGRNCTPTAPKVRQVLGLLLSKHGQIVELDSIIRDLWEEEPPRSAVTTTQTYIYQLRKIFAQEMSEDAAERLLETVSPGYVLNVRAEDLDSQLFARHVAQGRLLASAGELHKGEAHLRQAMALWRGPVLSNVEHGPVLRGWRVYLEELRIGAVELLVRFGMDLGRERELLPELNELVLEHPYNEWFHMQLITALGRVGRRGEALRAYDTLRRLLANELGLDPSPEAQRLQRAMLAGEPMLVAAAERAS